MTHRFLAILLPAAALLAQTDLTSAQKEYFESRIRPVLAQQCFVCHTNSQAGGLRLDTREDLLKGGKTGPAVSPGDPERSLLISAIRHAGQFQMPKNAVKLTDGQIQDFTQWVKDGAYWPKAEVSNMVITEKQKQRWSYLPLQSGPVPAVKDKTWPVNDIDRHVLARLEGEGLRPGDIADRHTLIRRVTYDLTGLPPTFEEAQAFLTDKSPNAWEKVIDRLLASPRYGERWARHWMDVVRYGEDDYNVGKMPDRAERYPHAYLYRDWLINAFNDDLPYDTFVKAQLAADLMEEKSRPKMIPALGMHGTGVWSFQDNPAPIERADEWHDKLDVTTKTFLGVTVGCARCHDHKYDPIPTRDYYRMAGIFASSKFHAYPQVPKAAWEAWEKQKKTLEEKEANQKKFLDQASELFAQSLLMQAPEYMVAAWQVGSQKRTTAQAVADEKKLDAEILDRWVRFLQKEPNNYPFLKQWQAMTARGGTENEAKQLAKAFHETILDVQREYAKIKEENEIALAKFKLKDQVEEFDPLPNFKKRRLNKHQIDLKSLDREKQYLWRDVFETDLPANPGNPNAEEKKKPGLLKLTEWALEKRLTGELAAHAGRLKSDIEAYKKAMPPEPPYVYGIAEGQPTTLRVFVRGNVYNFGEEAPRGFLSLFSNGDPQLFEKGSGRLDLAEAILKQPVAMRVVANRIWRWHMGTGIVDTPNNFGMLGAAPTNQRLLDHLASRFVEGGYSWKKLHREILLSRTYQLSSKSIETNFAKDPANKLYWRSNRHRLDAESVWDSVLTASAKLDTSSIGGPSGDLGEAKMLRRGIYGRVSRMYPNDFLATFDAPAATISAEFRYMTNVPLQKLFFLNSEVVRQNAHLAAERIRGAGGPEAQVNRAYQILYQRLPSPAELSFALDFLRRAETEAAPMKAEIPPMTMGIAAKPERPAADVDAVAAPPAGENAPKLTPLDSLCWALMSSNEFLYIN